MIASYSRNFIFIKTRKTAGTSAEIIFSSWCSGSDICTTVTGEDELKRREYGGMAMNFSEDPEVVAEFDRLVEAGDAEAIQSFRKQGKPTYYNHMSGSEVRELLPDLWSRAYKFTVERHPYERAVSAAWWGAKRREARGEKVVSINSYIDRVIQSEHFRNYPLYIENGKLVVDEVILYPGMWERIADLGRTFGAPPIGSMPDAKASYRRDRRPAVDILSEDQKRKIVKACSIEFEMCEFEY